VDVLCEKAGLRVVSSIDGAEEKAYRISTVRFLSRSRLRLRLRQDIQSLYAILYGAYTKSVRDVVPPDGTRNKQWSGNHPGISCHGTDSGIV